MKCRILTFLWIVPALYAAQGADVHFYKDSEIDRVYEAFVSDRHDGLLKVVPEGETKPVAMIFKTLGLVPTRLPAASSQQLNMVKFLTWRVSPSYSISIMIAINDRTNDFSDAMKLKGYGVRLYKQNKR